VKNILALDLGTTTGWAYRDSAGKVTAGSWLLQRDADRKRAAKERLDRRLDPRIPLLYQRLRLFWIDRQLAAGNEAPPIDLLVFEDVQFSRYTMQTQLWASFRATTWLFCYLHNIQTDCIPVTTLKKLATGSGAADKAFMIREASKLFPKVAIVDDNCADALHLLQWATTLTKRIEAAPAK